MNMFDELTKSLVEAIAISNSEAAPSRVTKIRIPDVKKIRTTNGLTQEVWADKIDLKQDKKVLNPASMRLLHSQH